MNEDINKEAKENLPDPEAPGPEFFKKLAQSNDSSEFYYNGRWRVLRYEILEQYGARCMCCGRSEKDGVIIEVDHIKPRARYKHLQYQKSNLQVLCRDCNKGKGAWDETDWRPNEPITHCVLMKDGTARAIYGKVEKLAIQP